MLENFKNKLDNDTFIKEILLAEIRRKGLENVDLNDIADKLKIFVSTKFPDHFNLPVEITPAQDPVKFSTNFDVDKINPFNHPSIGNNTITCCECGMKAIILSAKHLAKHGLSVDAYKAKWNIAPSARLIAKSVLASKLREYPASDFTPEYVGMETIQDDFIYCCECGAKKQIITERHLKEHNLTKNEYKAKWGIPNQVRLASKKMSEVRSKNRTILTKTKQKKLKNTDID